MIIRQVSEQTEVEARNVVLAGLKEHFGELDLSLNPDLDGIVRNYVERGDVFLIGIHNNEVVATGALVQEEPETGRIVRMSVLKKFRRKGLARKVLSELEIIAKSKGFRSLVLETTSTWCDAIEFYLANGYKISGEKEGEMHFLKKIER